MIHSIHGILHQPHAVAFPLEAQALRPQPILGLRGGGVTRREVMGGRCEVGWRSWEISGRSQEISGSSWVRAVGRASGS